MNGDVTTVHIFTPLCWCEFVACTFIKLQQQRVQPTAVYPFGGIALDETLSYDVQGNIQNLNRTGSRAATLGYTYLNSGQSNQLASVTNGTSPFRSYSYDANGNANTDGAISTTAKTLTYNLLNLPQSVSQPGNPAAIAATYTYDASGQKLRNTGTDGSWGYISGIVYNNGAIKFVATEEGRLLRSTTDGSYAYEYDLKDHLGDVRVSFKKNTSGAADVVQEDEYYAFGLHKPVLDASNTNR